MDESCDLISFDLIFLLVHADSESPATSNAIMASASQVRFMLRLLGLFRCD